MKEKQKALVAKMQANTDQIKAVTAKEDYSAADDAIVKGLRAENDTIRGEIALCKSQGDNATAAADDDAYLNSAEPAGGARPPHGGAALKTIDRIPHHQVQNFKGATPEIARQKAYDFGMWFLGAFAGNEKARAYCKTRGYEFKAGDQSEGNNADGAVLVPVQFDNDIIVLREEYGVIRRNTKMKIMTSDTLVTPRRKGGLTAYPIGPGQTIPSSKKNWDMVELTARKWGVLVVTESELNEDAVINMGDDLAGEIAYAFSQSEDECAFMGDGTSAYHGIVGITNALQNLNGTVANIAGIQVASSSTWSALTVADFTGLKGRMPAYALKAKPKWYCSVSFYAEVMERLMLQAGGNREGDLLAGVNQFKFLGYPVEVSQVLPLVTATNQLSCIFGALQLGTTFGDRRRTTIAISDHAEFAADERVIRGTERFDFNVHDVGNASATASLRVAGPIGGLQMASS